MICAERERERERDRGTDRDMKVEEKLNSSSFYQSSHKNNDMSGSRTANGDVSASTVSDNTGESAHTTNNDDTDGAREKKKV